ncbi:Lsr2 dimerization domain-containing protein [Nocardia grenadensis]|uniref:Lsr2 dimerization domain-containing protein n=1 Tax=Nocardia grenadensis TaxID=931537 RepID=UPI003D751840
MAKEVVYKDDLTGEEIDKDLVGGNPTFVFEWEGHRYAIDLGLKSRDKFSRAIKDLLDNAHPATEDEDPLVGVLSQKGRRNPRRGPKPEKTGSEISPEKQAEIRAWLQQTEWENPTTGKKVGDVGRLPAAGIEAYEAEHGSLSAA